MLFASHNCKLITVDMFGIIDTEMICMWNYATENKASTTQIVCC